MLASYSRPNIINDKYEFADSKMKNSVNKNLENIVGEVELHPETEFVFFMPPFSVVYWDAELRKGTFDATMDCVKYAISNIIEYDNVKIYFYQNEEDIITDLNNYKDYSHYGPWINDKITEYISKDYRLMTEDNYDSMIEEMRSFINSYNYEKIFMQ